MTDTFLSFIKNNYFKKDRSLRQEIKMPSRFCLYTQNHSDSEKNDLLKGTIINVSSKGIGLIFDTDSLKKYEKNNYKNTNIYIETFSQSTNAKLKLHGSVKWLKTKKDLKKPFCEMGIELRKVEQDSKEQVFNSLFMQKN